MSPMNYSHHPFQILLTDIIVVRVFKIEGSKRTAQTNWEDFKALLFGGMQSVLLLLWCTEGENLQSAVLVDRDPAGMAFFLTV
mmetsp:Transcript_29984/g.68778  ORF Transcript_29984/g.68778 Transcript_29984/m.68778 type:complete len:83 (+) Transcript_29984:60-308(+)